MNVVNQSKTNNISRLYSLDGLRAISILLVLVGHLSHTDQFQKSISYYNYYDWSDFGVHIFFVISGFLITTLLLKEESGYGKIGLKNFYIRRFLRIFPAYYFFLFCIYLMNLKFNLNIKSFTAPLTFTTGLPIFDGRAGWTLGHTWSLAVEEQFYILYPFFLVLFNKKSVRLTILLIGVILFPLLRSYLYHTCYPAFSYSILYRGDCIIWGCMLAFYSEKIKIYFETQKALINYIIILLFGIVITLRICIEHLYLGILTVPFVNTFQSLLALSLIIKYTLIKTNTDNLVFKFLNSRVMVFIGVLSYSIYLWQQLVIQPHTSEFPWAWFPLNIFLVFVLAFLSYKLVEKPFLKLKVYFNRIR